MPAPAEPKTVIAIRHVHFKDRGGFKTALADAGFVIGYNDLGRSR